MFKIINFESGYEAKNKEQELLKLVVRNGPTNYLKSGGNTELFSEPLCQNVF